MPLKDFTVNPAGTQAAPGLCGPYRVESTITFSAAGGGISALVYSDGKSENQVVFDNPNNLAINIAQAPGQTVILHIKIHDQQLRHPACKPFYLCETAPI